MNSATERLSTALAGRYRVDRELGAGGMATVYLAQDLRHQRHVAVKVLRAELAAMIGAERFLSEIRTTANLQHPHILPLFDSGEADGFLFYVMPFVEGESLRDRLNREKQLPIGDAVRISREVASALDYAHRHHVIHRDIKPENILMHDGQALVADFGIALAVTSAGGSRLTETGMSLGTPHYMSPEQATGEREITGRSDVYALGAVLYEMLLGEPPFTGPTAQAIVARVITEEPRRIISQRRSVSPALEDAVITALEKLPADRFSSAADFAKALVDSVAVAGHPGVPRTLSPTAAARLLPRGGLLGWVIAGVATLAALWLAVRPHSEAAIQPPSHLAILAPGLGGSGNSSLHRQVALTPDGATVIFVAVASNGQNHLMRQPLYASEATTIPEAAGIANPLVSPDGRWVIGTGTTRAQAGSAYRFPLDGGPGSRLPRQIRSTAYAAWSNDGSLWISADLDRGLSRIGGPDSVTRRFPERTSDLVLQQILPDERTAIMVRRPPGASTGLSMLFDLETGDNTVLLNAAVVEVRYTGGHLVYVLPDGTLHAVPFDPGRRRIIGPSVSLASGISITGLGIAQLAVAPNGTLAYIHEEPRTLVFMDRSGSAHPATADRRNFHAPRFSQDGRRLSTDLTSADGRDVWILSLDQGTLSRATFDRDGHDATWTPDGRSITYSSTRAGPLGIYRTRPGSATPAESLLTSSKLAYTGIWLRDGSALVTMGNELGPGSRIDIAIVRNGGRGPISPLVASQFNEQYVAVSPDGRWIAFVSDQSGQQQVYARPLEGEGDQIQVSLSGGNDALWGPDGREIFYRAATQLMVASVRTRPQFEVTSRRQLFEIGDIISTTTHTNYDISPDGRTFAMVRRSPSTRVMVIQNLPELVRRLRGATASP
ncbi:MAG: protein kinase [Anaerolineae bacterium]|nr:protein kinase [Gemmatimonadaceae bacterium]